MFERLKKYWQSLKNGEPGSRFLEQYEAERRSGTGAVGRALRIGVGAILIPAGLFFLAVPGPGIPIIGLGALLIAREFRFAAVALDWLEVRGRRAFAWGERRWKRLVRARRAVVR